MIRNRRELGEPIWTTTHGGYTLLLANNPLMYDHFNNNGPGRDWDADNFHQHWSMRRQGDPTTDQFWKAPVNNSANPDIQELYDDRLAQSAALATIKRDPKTFLLSCVYRLGWLWAVFPYGVAVNQQWMIGAWYTLWYIMAIVGLIRLREALTSRVWLLPLTLLLLLTAIHAIYWSNMRMRAPLMPIVYIVACWPLMRVKVPV